MHPARLVLNKGVRHRILQGHPWVFASEVGRIDGDPIDGETVEIRAVGGQFLGSGLFNQKSQIIARRYSFKNEPLDEACIRHRLIRAIYYRKELQPGTPDAQRLVWSESDELPGLIVDRYRDVLVFQTLTLAMARRETIIVQLLAQLLPVHTIIARNDASVRRLEGLPLENHIVLGEYHGATEVTVANIPYKLDLRCGHKTGFYLDQVENYEIVARYSKDRRVLDCFTNQGAFALSSSKAGARSVIAIDQSLPALEVARETSTRTGLQIDWRPGNVFDLLPIYARQKLSFDLIILDPPSFTKSKDNKDSALRGYHELNIQALRLLEPGGMLATFSCSHHITSQDWLELLENAAADSECGLRLRHRLSATPDHPVLVNVPETEYLRGYVVEKI